MFQRVKPLLQLINFLGKAPESVDQHGENQCAEDTGQVRVGGCEQKMPAKKDEKSRHNKNCGKDLQKRFHQETSRTNMRKENMISLYNNPSGGTRENQKQD
ncbi:hypothetical protein H6B10_09070 [Gemmiger formicilis]|nr:hypothetical protein [Gemmiger formicilis]